MASVKYISSYKLTGWLDSLAQTNRVLVPTTEGERVVFRPHVPGRKPVLSSPASAPPKSAVFPACQELFRYTRNKDAAGLPPLVFAPDTASPPTVVFGTRPCDARGFLVFDRVYQEGKHSDPYYSAAREATFFITMACDRVLPTCFCHWTGSGPSDPAGSDVLLTPVAGGFTVESCSERGKRLLEHPSLEDGTGHVIEADDVKRKARENLGEMVDLAGASAAFPAVFDDLIFWNGQADKCLSCGACTYLCPTCHCFTLSEEPEGTEGRRLRSWDSCMSYQFTVEASGHNPRPTTAHRLRNRVGHKFSYFPELHEGLIACCGCGRCIRSCPVSLDVREILRALADRSKEARNAS